MSERVNSASYGTDYRRHAGQQKDLPKRCRAILENYRSAVPGQRYPTIRSDFDAIVRLAPKWLVAHGICAALRGRYTPSLPALLSKLVRTADPELQIDLVRLFGASANQDPTDIIERIQAGISIAPALLSGLAAVACRRHASLVDDLSPVLLRHPALSSTLDGITLTYALAAMAEVASEVSPRRRTRGVATIARKWWPWS